MTQQRWKSPLLRGQTKPLSTILAVLMATSEAQVMKYAVSAQEGIYLLQKHIEETTRFTVCVLLLCFPQGQLSQV